MSKFVAVRSEEEVGILHRLGTTPRFEATFKERFSDFHVNEIDLNGKIVQLTDLSPPIEKKSEIAEDDPQILSWIPAVTLKSVVDLQDRFQKETESGKFHKSDRLWKENVLIKVSSLGKQERTRIHRWLGNYDKLNSETVDKDGEKYIVAMFDNKNKRGRRRPASRPKFTHFTMYKEGVDTSEAIGLLSKRLRIKPNLITFCGTKDKHGKTTQRLCISNVDASRLIPISKDSKSIKLGNYEYNPHHLRLGDLKGNHFKILLRNAQPESDEVINAAVEGLRASGFINYFGLQRFGSYEVSTHQVGKSILQNNWVEACDLILKPKNNDTEFMKEAKAEWLTNRDPKAAVEKFPSWHQRSIESNLLFGLSKYYSKNDFVGVFMRVPRNVRHLYIHSFQSYLWNRVASFRVEKLGMQPVVGDVVYVDKDQQDFFVEDIHEESDEEEESSSNTQPTLTRPTTIKVKVLTEEDLPNYTIFDVLIPIQGTEIRLPENTRIREFYDQILKEEGIDSDFFLKFKPSSDQPKGAYRKLLIRPQNLLHKIIPYNDSDNVDQFIPSEVDKLNEDFKTLGNGSTSDAVKDKKCVILEMSLPSSSYATMALREITTPNKSGPDLEEKREEAKDPESCNDEPEHEDGEPESKRRRCDPDA